MQSARKSTGGNPPRRQLATMTTAERSRYEENCRAQVAQYAENRRKYMVQLNKDLGKSGAGVHSNMATASLPPAMGVAGLESNADSPIEVDSNSDSDGSNSSYSRALIETLAYMYKTESSVSPTSDRASRSTDVGTSVIPLCYPFRILFGLHFPIASCHPETSDDPRVVTSNPRQAPNESLKSWSFAPYPCSSSTYVHLINSA